MTQLSVICAEKEKQPTVLEAGRLCSCRLIGYVSERLASVWNEGAVGFIIKKV